MRYTVFRSLDDSPVTFGIQGSYLSIFFAGAGVSLLAGIVAGMFTSALLGMIIFLVGAGASYMTTLIIQGKYTEREKKRVLASRSMPTFIFVDPRAMEDRVEYISDSFYVSEAKKAPGKNQ